MHKDSFVVLEQFDSFIGTSIIATKISPVFWLAIFTLKNEYNQIKLGNIQDITLNI